MNVAFYRMSLIKVDWIIPLLRILNAVQIHIQTQLYPLVLFSLIDMRKGSMTNVLILGAAGSVARVTTRYLLDNSQAQLTLYVHI